MKKWFIRIAGLVKLWLDEVLQNENERQFREQIKKLNTLRLESVQKQQSSCPHIAGCNSLSESRDLLGRTSIVWHRLNTGEDVGICTNCHRNFFPSDPDYAEWRAKHSFNRMSGAPVYLDKTIKAEPFLCRVADPPPPVPMKNSNYPSTSDDPWLRHKDGNLDELAIAAVDFGFAGSLKPEEEEDEHQSI